MTTINTVIEFWSYAHIFTDKHDNIINDDSMTETNNSEITGLDGHEATYDHLTSLTGNYSAMAITTLPIMTTHSELQEWMTAIWDKY